MTTISLLHMRWGLVNNENCEKREKCNNENYLTRNLDFPSFGGVNLQASTCTCYIAIFFQIIISTCNYCRKKVHQSLSVWNHGNRFLPLPPWPHSDLWLLHWCEPRWCQPTQTYHATTDTTVPLQGTIVFSKSCTPPPMYTIIIAGNWWNLNLVMWMLSVIDVYVLNLCRQV